MVDQETKEMAASITAKFSYLHDSLTRRSIYKVPEHIRRGKERCYRPLLVSIGPVYFRDASLQSMEKYKLSHLQCFLMHRGNPHDVEHYITLLKAHESKIRNCYEQEVSSIPSKEFIEMVLVDAAFTIYFFTMSKGIFPFDEDIRPMHGEIWRDLFLEENQLPFFVLKDMFQEAFRDSDPNTSFHDVARDLIAKGMMPLPGLVTASSARVRNRVDDEESNIEHLVHMMRIFCLPSNPRVPMNPTRSALRFPPSVSNLKAAGVKFVASKTKSLLDVTFVKGVLEMPVLVVSDSSESLIRSIMLFEQRHLYSESYFIDYIYLLDKLIDTADDVSILVRSGVLENRLGSEQAVVDLFNGIANHLTFDAPNIQYYDVCLNLLKFTAIRWNRWKTILRKNYFRHPWAIISVIYATILLILTILQTISSFISK